MNMKQPTEQQAYDNTILATLFGSTSIGVTIGLSAFIVSKITPYSDTLILTTYITVIMLGLLTALYFLRLVPRSFNVRSYFSATRPAIKESSLSQNPTWQKR